MNKKLSIEEKAKAYDKAIERAKQHCADYVVETIFPELKESEDERIRKALIHLVNSNKELSFGIDNYDGIKWSDILAWLEKQGEQNLANSAKTCKDEQNPNPCDGCVNRKGCINCENGELREVEQKPADKVEPKFKIKYAGSEYNVLEVKDIAGVTFYGIEDEPNHIDYVQAENCERVDGYSIKESGSPFPTKLAKFSEQSSTWSEEDEALLNALIRSLEGEHIYVSPHLAIECLKHLKERVQPQPKQEWSEEDEVALGDALWCCKQAASIAKDENDMGNVWFAENWLKSLKDRVQPKQEWSEDDEKMFNRCVKTIKGAYYLDGEALYWLENRFKSLRPHSHWKPSDEQMEALDRAQAELCNTEYNKPICDLIDSLKKLKG